MKQLEIGKVRVQLLTEKILRLECSETNVFFDGNTLFVPDRNFATDCRFEYINGAICFGEYKLYVPQNARSLKGIKLEKNRQTVYTYKKLKNSGELPTLKNTPDVFAVSDTPRITVPACGYTSNPEAKYTVEENVQDVYLLLCGGDYKELRKLYVTLTGKSELVRLSTLGGWNSKYYAYTQQEAEQLILDYEAHNVPLDVMVIDTDWRTSEFGWGYDINEKLFPDMKDFFEFAHRHGVEIIFNDHPEPVNGAHVFEPEEIAYREKNLQSLMEKGLDMWWYDRNWRSHLNTPTENVYWETFGLYLFEDITRHYFQKVAKDKKIYRRPVIMGNVVNVANGIYNGICDSASHRFSIQWTGDVESTGEALAQEVDTLLKCSENCIPYANADCGGHFGDPDKEQFIRWMQFGTLSPVFRPHCNAAVKRFREPWVYDEETLDIVREYNNLRYRLLPIMYKSAYESYENGEPIFKSLGWNYPADKKALNCRDGYMLGNDILISPIAGNNPVPLKASEYTAPVSAVFYDGTKLEGEPIADAKWKALEMDLHHTGPVQGVPAYKFSARFKTKIKFNRKVKLYIKYDDGCSVFVDGEKLFEDLNPRVVRTHVVCNILDKNEHDIEIEYFQDLGVAHCSLCACDYTEDAKKQVYLPEGKWLDVFGGNMYYGGKKISMNCGLREMPLFVRLGALLPLAYAAHNTKNQKWNRLVLDYYPSKEASDCGYLYEDDTETTAYKFGQLRKSAYSANYDSNENAYIVKLNAAEGEFKGKKAVDNREIMFKYHLLNDADKLEKVTINGTEINVKKNICDKSAFPLSASLCSCDGNTVTFKIKTDVYQNYEIKFFLSNN